MISGLLALLGAELFSHSWNFPGTMSLHTYIPGYILASFAIAITWVSKEYQRVQKMLLTLTAGVFLLTFHLPLISKPSGITSAVATIMTLGLTAFLMASLNERRLFQQLLFFVGLRFLVLYFQAFGGLARTGFGLIISGTFVIALTVLWNKSRTALSIWAERIVK
ncbi:hypothetical protein EBZ37_02860 [bacterium]|nr:hypothetical protein [bacterium]